MFVPAPSHHLFARSTREVRDEANRPADAPRPGFDAEAATVAEEHPVRIVQLDDRQVATPITSDRKNLEEGSEQEADRRTQSQQAAFHWLPSYGGGRRFGIMTGSECRRETPNRYRITQRMRMVLTTPPFSRHRSAPRALSAAARQPPCPRARPPGYAAGRLRRWRPSRS